MHTSQIEVQQTQRLAWNDDESTNSVCHRAKPSSPGELQYLQEVDTLWKITCLPAQTQPGERTACACFVILVCVEWAHLKASDHRSKNSRQYMEPFCTLTKLLEDNRHEGSGGPGCQTNKSLLRQTYMRNPLTPKLYRACL